MLDKLTLLAISVGSDPNSTTEVVIPTSNPDMLLTNALYLTYFIAGVIAVIVIVIAGIMYTASGGDVARITKGRNLLIYSITGLVVVLTAFVLTNFVIGRFI